MNNETTKVYLTQGEGEAATRMALELSQEVTQKMQELREQDPMKWNNRDLDLLIAAKQELGLITR